MEGDRSCGGQEALMETGEWVHGGWGGEVGEGEGVAGSLQRFWFPPGSVFVLWMVIHVFCSNTFGFIYKWSLLDFCQQFPL